MKKFKPLTRDECLTVIAEYGTGEYLWQRFYAFLDKQDDDGAPYEYIKACFEMLESVWQEQSNFCPESVSETTLSKYKPKT